MADDDRPASQPVHDVTVELDVRIPMDDGLELSANLWRPVPRRDRPDERCPVILECREDAMQPETAGGSWGLGMRGGLTVSQRIALMRLRTRSGTRRANANSSG